MNVEVALTSPIVVHVVDATSNVEGFEHACTRAMTKELRASKLNVTSSSPHLANEMGDLVDAFAVEEEWNVLLFVSHGEREKEKADYLRLGDHDAHWFLANGIKMNLRDKGVFLCVCEGYSDDACSVLINEQLALWLVAPMAKITDSQARAFFPAVIHELHEKGVRITPECASQAVDNHNVDAGGTMAVRSGVGLLSQGAAGG